jgi:hypothetical protein
MPLPCTALLFAQELQFVIEVPRHLKSLEFFHHLGRLSRKLESF